MNNDLTIAELQEQTANQMEIILQQSNEIDSLEKTINNCFIVIAIMSIIAFIFGILIINK